MKLNPLYPWIIRVFPSLVEIDPVILEQTFKNFQESSYPRMVFQVQLKFIRDSGEEDIYAF